MAASGFHFFFGPEAPQQRYLHWLCLALVCFILGGERGSGCSARCVCAPGIGGCSYVSSGAAVQCVVLGCVCVNCVGWSLSGDGGMR